MFIALAVIGVGLLLLGSAIAFAVATFAGWWPVWLALVAVALIGYGWKRGLHFEKQDSPMHPGEVPLMPFPLLGKRNFIRIVSDGSTYGTKVFDLNGHEIAGLTRVQIDIDANGHGLARAVLYADGIEVEAIVPEVSKVNTP